MAYTNCACIDNDLSDVTGL